MFKSSLQTIGQLKEILMKLPSSIYTKTSPALSGSTIGQHTRHIIELYQCLLEGYDSGNVCYDNRRRDRQLEQDLSFATSNLTDIQAQLEKNDKSLLIHYELDGCDFRISSSYFREVIYNLEHTIHHEA